MRCQIIVVHSPISWIWILQHCIIAILQHIFGQYFLVELTSVFSPSSFGKNLGTSGINWTWLDLKLRHILLLEVLFLLRSVHIWNRHYSIGQCWFWVPNSNYKPITGGTGNKKEETFPQGIISWHLTVAPNILVQFRVTKKSRQKVEDHFSSQAVDLWRRFNRLQQLMVLPFEDKKYPLKNHHSLVQFLSRICPCWKSKLGIISFLWWVKKYIFCWSKFRRGKACISNLLKANCAYFNLQLILVWDETHQPVKVFCWRFQ